MIQKLQSLQIKTTQNYHSIANSTWNCIILYVRIFLSILVQSESYYGAPFLLNQNRIFIIYTHIEIDIQGDAQNYYSVSNWAGNIYIFKLKAF